MARDKSVAGLGTTWFSLSSDLLDLKLDPFHKGLSRQRRAAYSVGVLTIALAFFLILDPYGALAIAGVGLWVVWNQGNTVTKFEKQIFLTIVDLAAFFGLVEKFSVFLQAAGLLAIMLGWHLWYIWGRK